MKPSLGGLEPSPDVHTASMTITMSIIAQKIPTAPFWDISRPWVPGQCQLLRNLCQFLRPARPVGALMKEDATSSSAANICIFALHVGEPTQPSNVFKGNHQAAAENLHAGTPLYILATLPLASKTSNTYS